MSQVSLRITNALGAQLSVALNSEDDVLDAMRFWGKKRWRTIDLPYGGLQFPLAMAETFDWTIIGAQPGTVKDSKNIDCAGVWFANKFYKRRDLPANEKKDLEACVKYSRGASAKDKANPNIYVEGEGTDSYVSLVIFRGTGAVQREYERPRSTSQTTAKPAAKREEPPLRGEKLADAQSQPSTKPSDADPITPELLRAIDAAIEKSQCSSGDVVDIVHRVTGAKRHYRHATMGQGYAIYREIAHFKAQVPA